MSDNLPQNTGWKSQLYNMLIWYIHFLQPITTSSSVKIYFKNTDVSAAKSDLRSSHTVPSRLFSFIILQLFIPFRAVVLKWVPSEKSVVLQECQCVFFNLHVTNQNTGRQFKNLGILVPEAGKIKNHCFRLL